MNAGARLIHILMPTTYYQHWKKSSLSSLRCTAAERAQLLGRIMWFSISPTISSSTVAQGPTQVNPFVLVQMSSLLPLTACCVTMDHTRNSPRASGLSISHQLQARTGEKPCSPVWKAAGMEGYGKGLSKGRER